MAEVVFYWPMSFCQPISSVRALKAKQQQSSGLDLSFYSSTFGSWWKGCYFLYSGCEMPLSVSLWYLWIEEGCGHATFCLWWW